MDRSTHQPRPFPPTSWSLVQRCQDPDDPEHREGLELLCRRYWPPAYFFIRRHWAPDADEARDLCQAFFATFLEKDFVRDVDGDRGRFRTFLCAALRHFLSKERRRERALKRRPADGKVLSIEALREADGSFDVADPSPADDPEFRRDWLRATIDAALEGMRAAATDEAGRARVEMLVRYELEPPDSGRPTHQDLARDLGLSPSQVNTGLRRARREFEERLAAEIRDQVATEADYVLESSELLA